MKTHREEIARIVDPEAWNWKPLPRAADEGPASKKAFDEQDRSDGQAMAARRASALAKADQIIAAWNRRADPLVEELRGALRQAEDWFREYADLHRAKCSADGDAKARTNTERADFCAREALALPVGNISARDLAPQPEPLTVPEPAANADKPSALVQNARTICDFMGWTEEGAAWRSAVQLATQLYRAPYEQGWNDREDDLIAGVSRISPLSSEVQPVAPCEMCGGSRVLYLGSEQGAIPCDFCPAESGDQGERSDEGKEEGAS